jgi:hypothetical protein
MPPSVPQPFWNRSILATAPFSEALQRKSLPLDGSQVPTTALYTAALPFLQIGFSRILTLTAAMQYQIGVSSQKLGIIDTQGKWIRPTFRLLNPKDFHDGSGWGMNELGGVPFILPEFGSIN